MSENGQEKRETLADIVADMRKAGALMPAAYMRDLLNYADRIEATWKREKAEAEADALAVGGLVEAERQKPGNAARMREAVVALLDALDSFWCDEDTAALAAFVPDMAESSAKCLAAFRKAKDALAAPERNCDVYRTSWDVVTHWDGGLDSAKSVVRMLDWLLAPTKAEKKGESNGSK